MPPDDAPTEPPTPVPARPWRALLPRKTQDVPHYLSLVLSLLAIGISIMGWLQSHASRTLAEEVNRPLLIIEGVQTSESPFFSAS